MRTKLEIVTFIYTIIAARFYLFVLNYITYIVNMLICTYFDYNFDIENCLS